MNKYVIHIIKLFHIFRLVMWIQINAQQLYILNNLIRKLQLSQSIRCKSKRILL
jgi:hypothetical protein